MTCEFFCCVLKWCLQICCAHGTIFLSALPFSSLWTKSLKPPTPCLSVMPDSPPTPPQSRHPQPLHVPRGVFVLTKGHGLSLAPCLHPILWQLSICVWPLPPPSPSGAAQGQVVLQEAAGPLLRSQPRSRAGHRLRQQQQRGKHPLQKLGPVWGKPHVERCCQCGW